MRTMKFWLEIACDNAAFEPDLEKEVARILREAAKKVADPKYAKWTVDPAELTLQDANGNTVGSFRFETVE